MIESVEPTESILRCAMASSDTTAQPDHLEEEWTFGAGDLLGERYRIVERLAAGAFGEVHAADDTQTDRRVALKVLRTEGEHRDPKAVARMRQEAEILRAIEHPNLVQVYDIGTEADHEFLVMELLEGRSIGDLIEAGEFADIERARPVAEQILSALDAMHARGVQHRDLKPDNIILLEEADAETVKLVDFGIAKAQDFLDSEHEFTLVQTQEEEFVGTPRYTAPEQAVGDPVGPSADIFSLGLVLAEWLTGTPRIEKGAERGVISILIQPQPIDVSDCPEEWQSWLEKMVAKTPEQRFESAEAALRALPGTEHPERLLETPDDEAESYDDSTVPLQKGAVAEDVDLETLTDTTEEKPPRAAVGSPGDPDEPTRVSDPNDAPDSEPPGRSSSPNRAQPPVTRTAITQTPDDSLDISTVVWTVLAALFFIVSLAIFIYTVLG